MDFPINYVQEIHEFAKTSSHQILVEVPFKKDKDLERYPPTSAQQCLETFFQKGGFLQSIANISIPADAVIQLQSGDAVYPVCSGGFCRSQTVWALLLPFSDQLILFPPHAARYGWDPYNGRINRFLNYEKEGIPDEFTSYFGLEKANRFGFENEQEWKSIELHPTQEGLQKITQFYDQHYYGPESSWKGKKGQRRIYIAFSHNVHVVLHRLNQCNENLNGVIVIAIDSEDLISHPPDFLKTSPRSEKSYEYFSHLIHPLLKVNNLNFEFFRHLGRVKAPADQKSTAVQY